MEKTIYLAGGCFWGTEKYFSLISGVKKTFVGYANGKTDHPTYEQVCHDNTGHAETVKVDYDDEIISLEELLELYYKVIDPVAVNRQGGDTGIQYRTGIYYLDDKEETRIKASLEHLQKSFRDPIAVECKKLEHFYNAEEYHQNYLDKNPNGYCHIGKQKFEEAKSYSPKKEQSPGTVYKKKSEEELKKILNPVQYEVTRNNATEPPFANEYHDFFEKGIYVDITTGEPLFLSEDKFQSGCGWPSFSKPLDSDKTVEKKDFTHGMVRTEVRSNIGDSHLGHVFNDGPKESGGLRYCINSASIQFIPYEEMEEKGYGYLRKYFK